MTSSTPHAFRHEALFYAGEEEFLAATLPPIREVLDADGAVLVVVVREKIAALQARLGQTAGATVRFADMGELGRNPGRIIPAWRRFLDDHHDGGRPLLGIGEPAHPGRSPEEIGECHRHEALLNVAFDEAEPWRLVCPYDVDALTPDVVAEARRHHPRVMGPAREVRPSTDFRRSDGGGDVFAAPEPAPTWATERTFTAADLSSLRDLVARRATALGLHGEQVHGIALAVDELASNSVRHGGGRGVLAVWEDGGSLVCEVRDSGWIRDPLAGRRVPALERFDGRGLWLVHHLCDLVQVHSTPDGTVARVRVAASRTASMA